MKTMSNATSVHISKSTKAVIAVPLVECYWSVLKRALLDPLVQVLQMFKKNLRHSEKYSRAVMLVTMSVRSIEYGKVETGIDKHGEVSTISNKIYLVK